MSKTITKHVLHRKSTNPPLRVEFHVHEREPKIVRMTLFKGEMKFDTIHHHTATGEAWKIHNNIWYSLEVAREVWTGMVNRQGYNPQPNTSNTP